MKNVIFLSAIVLISGMRLSAQSVEEQPLQKQDRKQIHKQEMSQTGDQDQIKLQKRDRIHNPEAGSHGKDVSAVAHSTESGPGKGEIVSQQARARGESQRMMHARNQNAKPKGPNVMRQNKAMMKGHAGGRK